MKWDGSGGLETTCLLTWVCFGCQEKAHKVAVMVPEGTGDGWGTEEVCLERGIVSPEARARGENRKQPKEREGPAGHSGSRRGAESVTP